MRVVDVTSRNRAGRPLVLLVDDDADSALLFRWLLEGEGYLVVWHTDGQAALTAATAVKPDVIVLELRVPVLPGPQMLRALKADEQTRSIPVVVLSAFVERLHPELHPLTAAVLRKPVDVEQLLDTMRAVTLGVVSDPTL